MLQELHACIYGGDVVDTVLRRTTRRARPPRARRACWRGLRHGCRRLGWREMLRPQRHSARLPSWSAPGARAMIPAPSPGCSGGCGGGAVAFASSTRGSWPDDEEATGTAAIMVTTSSELRRRRRYKSWGLAAGILPPGADTLWSDPPLMCPTRQAPAEGGGVAQPRGRTRGARAAAQDPARPDWKGSAPDARSITTMIGGDAVDQPSRREREGEREGGGGEEEMG